MMSSSVVLRTLGVALLLVAGLLIVGPGSSAQKEEQIRTPCDDFTNWEPEGNPGPNRLHEAGLTQDRVPRGLFAQFKAGGFYCLGSDRVDAVFLEFRNAANEVVVSWLVIPDDHGTQEEWREYLTDLYEDQFPVEFHSRSNAVIAVRADRPETSMARSLVAKNRDVSIWEPRP